MAMITATPPATSRIGKAAKAAVSSPRLRRASAVPSSGWAIDSVVACRNALMRFAARLPNVGRRDTTTSRLAHPLSSVERATVPFSRISLRCLAVGFSVRCDLSAMSGPEQLGHRSTHQVEDVVGQGHDGQDDADERHQDLEGHAEDEDVDLWGGLGQQGQHYLRAEQYDDDRSRDLDRGGE